MALENKLGLTSSADLARAEERISKKKALELFENGVLDQLEAGKFSALKAIHKYLFDEIYDFAGELRTVNISKGNFRFAPLMYLEAALANIDKMPQSTFDEIVEKYVEMNIEMCIRDRVGVPEEGRYIQQRHILIAEDAGEGVAQIVEPNLAQTVLLDQVGEPLCDPIRAYQPARCV